MSYTHIQVLLSLLISGVVFFLMTLVISYIDADVEDIALGRKANKESYKTKKKEKNGENKSFEDELKTLLELSDDEAEELTLARFQKKKASFKVETKTAIMGLSKKDDAVGLTQLIIMAVVVSIVLTFLSISLKMYVAPLLAFFLGIIYPVQFVYALAMCKGYEYQVQSQKAMVILLSMYLDCPNFDVAVKDTLKIINEGTSIRKKLEEYYDSTTYENKAKDLALNDLLNDLKDDYFFYTFMLTVIKAESMDKSYKHNLVSIPKRYMILIQENKATVVNMVMSLVVYILGLLLMFLTYFGTLSLDEQMPALMASSTGVFYQVAAYSVYAVIGFGLIPRIKISKG